MKHLVKTLLLTSLVTTIGAITMASAAGTPAIATAGQASSSDARTIVYPLPKPCVPSWQMPQCPRYPFPVPMSAVNTDTGTATGSVQATTVKGATGCIYNADRWGKPTGKPLSCPPYFVSKAD